MWHPNYSSLRSLSPSSSIRVPSRSKNTHSTAQVSKVELARKKKIEKVEALKQLYLNKPENERGWKLNYTCCNPIFARYIAVEQPILLIFYCVIAMTSLPVKQIQ